ARISQRKQGEGESAAGPPLASLPGARLEVRALAERLKAELQMDRLADRPARVPGADLREGEDRVGVVLVPPVHDRAAADAEGDLAVAEERVVRTLTGLARERDALLVEVEPLLVVQTHAPRLTVVGVLSARPGRAA